MGARTGISWTDATWNPVVGCTRVSAGCDHCYAFALHDRRHIAWKRGRWPDAPAQYHQPFSRVQMLEERLIQPLAWRAPRRVFVNSMSDLFHEDMPDAFITQVFAVMALAPQHTFQVLTKRPERMAAWVQGAARGVNLADAAISIPLPSQLRQAVITHGITVPWPLANVWLGVSVEHQEAAEARIPHLLQTPAAVRFISAEPLLGPLRLDALRDGSWYDREGASWYDALGGMAYYGGTGEAGLGGGPRLDWVIAGGESGSHARPVAPDWVRALRDQCQDAAVPYFFKQWGGPRPAAGGRELDGRTHDGFPEAGAE